MANPHADRVGRLRVAHSRLSTLIELLPDAILVEDEHRRIALTNPGFRAFFGIQAPPEQLLGADCGEMAQAAAPYFTGEADFVDRVAEIIGDQQPVREEPLALKDGRRVLRDYAPILTEDGFRGHLWRYRDVTEVWNARRELEQLNDFYRQVMDAMPVQLAVFDSDLRYRYLSPTAARNPEVRKAILGRTDEEHARIMGRSTDDALTRMAVLSGVLESGESLSFEETVRDADGKPRHYRRIVSPVFREGKVEQVLGFGVDVTNITRATAALTETEARYKMLVEDASEIIYRTDAAGRIQYANQTALLGFAANKADHALGRSYLEFVHPEDRRRVRAFYLRQVRNRVENTYLEFRTHSSEESLRWLGQNVQLLVEGDEVSGFQAIARDITDRKRADQALADSEARKAGMIAASLDAIVTIDVSGRVTDFNPAATTTFGFDRDEIVGRNMADFIIPERYRELHHKGLARYLETGEHHVLGQRIEIEALRKDGSEFLIEMAITPQAYADGRSFTAFIRDISDAKELEERQKQARELVEESMKAREQFLANMSHEMRTPLNAVIGMTHLLERTELRTEQAEFVSSIRYAGSTLLALINDLLDLSKIVAGRIEFEVVPFSLRRLLNRLIETLRPKANEKGLRLRWAVDGDLPQQIAGDPTRLNQILLNLVGNAIKFTHEGSVSLSVDLVERSAESVVLEIAVEDTGIGIEPKELETIFDEFVQASSSTTRSFGGTGLGLAIVRELTTRQGGSVEVESTAGEGSVFRIRLEFAVPQQSDLIIPGPEFPPSNSEPSEALAGMRILLAEDNELNRLVATQLLRGWGALVVEAVDGAEAIYQVRRQEFDLLVLDIQMPIMDGTDVARMVRGELKLTELPILALTASIVEQQRPELLEAGIDRIMAKPFDPQELLRQALELTRSSPEARQTEPGSRSETDLSALIDLSGGDNAFLVRLLDILLRQLPEFAEMLTVAAQGQNFADAGYVVHKMKASIGSLREPTLAGLLSDLENVIVAKNGDRLAHLAVAVSRGVNAVLPALQVLRDQASNSDG